MKRDRRFQPADRADLTAGGWHVEKTKRLLNLSAGQREHPSRLALLAMDNAVQEVLQGLKRQDSHFLVGFIEHRISPRTEQERERLAKLVAKRERVRLLDVPRADAPIKDEGRLG
jgi:hypothetical protein